MDIVRGYEAGNAQSNDIMYRDVLSIITALQSPPPSMNLASEVQGHQDVSTFTESVKQTETIAERSTQKSVHLR